MSIFLASATAISASGSTAVPLTVAGQEGLEPPTPGFGDRCSTIELLACTLRHCRPYFVSLCAVCLRHQRQYLLSSSRSVVFFLFFVVDVVPPLAVRALEDDVVAHRPPPLLDDLGDGAGADGAAALADGEAQPFSIAIGVISSIVHLRVVPGITISTPSGSVATPVTSVVRK